MANKKVWHGGSNTAPYETWATAATTLATAAAAAGVGEAVEIADDHTGDSSGTTAYSISFAGVAAAPTLCYVVNRTTGLKSNTRVRIKRTGTSGTISITGCVRASTLEIEVGTSTNGSALTLSGSASPDEVQIYRDCIFRLLGTGTTNRINFGNVNTSTRSHVRWVDCWLQGTTTAGTGILRSSGGVAFDWTGGGIEAGSADFPYLFDFDNVRPMAFSLSNLDFTAAGDALELVSPTASNSSTIRGRMENIAMPSGWTGSIGELGNPGANIVAVNVGGANVNYQFAHLEFRGRATHDTGVYRTGGASNGGVTPLSWRLSTGADAKWLTGEYVGPEMAIPCETTGAKTVTVEVLTDNVTLTDRDFGLEVTYLGDPTSCAGSLERTINEDYTGSATNLTTSSASWSGTSGFTNPVKQKVSVSITVEKAGLIVVRPILSRANTTVYVDPEPVLT